jgi:hypothetical protein
MEMQKQAPGKISRRNLLKGAVTVVGTAGAAAIAPFGLDLLSRAEAKSAAAGNWPWPYEKLDPAKTAEIAYTDWYRLKCGAAVINSVFSQLAQLVGEPYASFPTEGFIFLVGGVSGWGTVCGSNAGANIVTNLIIGPKTGGSDAGMVMGSEIMQWYCEASMPVYTPPNPKVKAPIPKTVSDSPLCHVSVGKWMKAANKPMGSPERKDRCARVAASVAYKTVELLNAWKDARYVPKAAFPDKMYHIPAQNNCIECHGSDVPAQ